MKARHPAGLRKHLGLPFLWMLALAPCFVPVPAGATAPPRPGEIERLRQSGELPARLAFGRANANHRVDPALVRRKTMEIEAVRAGRSIAPLALPYPTGLPSQGNPRAFALLIDFSDYPHTNAETFYSSRLSGVGDSAEQPYESLRSYYQRSSYNQLDIRMDTLPWYRAKNKRSTYDPGTLIQEALDSFAASRDFTVYDNNGDGIIDFFSVFWTGPDTGWNTRWWAWCGGFDDASTYRLDGKRLRTFSWQWADLPADPFFHPFIKVAIHETGHGLGLPDLYDYDDSIGPRGGVGGLDMMDANLGDHNAFSKWLLGWLAPTYVTQKGAWKRLTLRPSSLYPDCAVVMPSLAAGEPFNEFFLVQNRARGTQATSNDFRFPSDGLVAWHVNAALDGTGEAFFYDNSYTSTKFVSLVQADGLQSIEAGAAADAGDFYTPGRYLSNSSTPNSRSSGGQITGASLLNVEKPFLFFPGTPFNTLYAHFCVASAPQGINLAISDVAEGIDNTRIPWYVSGSSASQLWYGELDGSGDSAHTSVVGNNQYASITGLVQGPAVLRFRWKVSSQPDADYLRFSVDGTELLKISGEKDWAVETVTLDAGLHVLSWEYRKDALIAGGSDRAWLDAVECAAVSLAEALDNGLLNWKTSSPDWFGQGEDYYYGGSAARTPPLADNAATTLSFNAWGPARLRFAWKVSSEAYDYLSLVVDGTVRRRISGEADWARVEETVGFGLHSIAFLYSKNGRHRAGADAGWVDKVSFDDPALGTAVSNQILPWNLFLPFRGVYPWTSGYDSDGVTRLLRSGLPAADASSVFKTWVVGPGTLAFLARVDPDSFSLDCSVELDGQYKRWIYQTDWTPQTLAIPEGGHEVSWTWKNLSSTTVATKRAYLAQVAYTPQRLTLPEALDAPALNWNAYGAATWVAAEDVGAWGYDWARTEPVADNQTAWLETALTGPGLLSFDWKVSSEPKPAGGGFGDDLCFLLGNSLVSLVRNGEQPWETKRLLVPPGTHNALWFYAKNAAGAQGQDRAWIDHVVFTPAPPLPEALDAPALPWTNVGSSDWYAQTLASSVGSAAAITGRLQKGQECRLRTVVRGPGWIQYAWKIASNSSNRLEIRVDGVARGAINGLVDWKTAKTWVAPGQHTVEWAYSKNSVFVDHDDAAWLDGVQFTPVPAGSGEAWVLYR